MKKILVVLAAAVLVLSFAGAAFAIHAEIPAETQAIVAKGSSQITIGGEIRVRGWYYDNLGTYFGGAVNSDPQDSNSKANYDQRVRLSIDAAVTPNVTGRILLETGNTEGSTTDIYSWGRLNQKPNATTTFNEAWIMYKGDGLFGFPAFVKVGHMPLKLGHGLFFDNTQYGDDAIVFAMDPTKDLHIGLLTIKASEGTVGNNKNTDDLDAYVGLFTYKMGAHTLGMNYTYINQSSSDLKFQNAAFHADGKVGGFGYKAEVDFQFGSVGQGSAESDFEGYGLMLAGNYNVNPVNIRGMFALGSGQKDDDDITEFQTLVGGIQHYAFVYDYRAATAALYQPLGRGAAAMTRGAGTGIANTAVYNLGLDWKATKDIGTKLDGYYFRAHKNPYGGSKDIGWEVDANMTYQLAKNLTYAINVGYFKGGSFYEELGAESRPVDDVKGATVVNNVLTLSF